MENDFWENYQRLSKWGRLRIHVEMFRMLVGNALESRDWGGLVRSAIFGAVTLRYLALPLIWPYAWRLALIACAAILWFVTVVRISS